MFYQSATEFISLIQVVSLQHGYSQLSWVNHHFSQWVELVCGVSVLAPVAKLFGVSPQVWWADKRKCLDCSPTVLQRLVPFHPTVSVALCCALTPNHQLCLLCMTLAGQFLLSLPLGSRLEHRHLLTWYQLLEFTWTSRHVASFGHLVDAVVALSCIPWFESAVVVHCKVVVCDNLFGLIPQLVRVGCCQWVRFDMIEVRDTDLVRQRLISSTGSLLS